MISLSRLTLTYLSFSAGHDRFEARSGKYFNSVQPWEHIKGSFPAAGVYMYSFCLRPDEVVQPSGRYVPMTFIQYPS